MATEATLERYQRGVTDASLNPAALAIPATATTSNGASIDLGTAYSSGKNPRLAAMDIRIVVDAQTGTTLPNTQTIIVDLQDSADDSTFTALYDNILTVTGTGSAVAETAIQFAVPNTARRYIRASVTTSGSGTGRDSTYVYVTTRF